MEQIKFIPYMETIILPIVKTTKCANVSAVGNHSLINKPNRVNTMKKTLIALAMATLAAGANAATIYDSADGQSIDLTGRAEARAAIKDGNVSDESRARLNITGKQAISDSMYGLGVYEVQFNTNEMGGATDTDSGTDELEVRLAYAAIGGDFGQVGFGKSEGSLGVITDFTDIMAYYGNSAADKLAVADRTDNMLSYQGAFLDNDLQLRASARFDDTASGTSGKYEDEDSSGYSFSGIYNIADVVNIGGGYAEQGKNKEGMIGINADISGLYLAALYTDGEKDFASSQYFTEGSTTDVLDYNGFEVATAYQIDSVKFTATYNKAETDGFTTVDNFAIDATYYFQPNFYSYASYNFNLLSEGDDSYNNDKISDTDAQDEIALGLRYDF